MRRYTVDSFAPVVCRRTQSHTLRSVFVQRRPPARDMTLSRGWSNYLSGARPFWYFVYYAFNRVDTDRLRANGPDRTCAEWILRNGGAVSGWDSPGQLVTDYNWLNAIGRDFRLHSIVARDIGVIAMGFDHLRGCERVQRIVLDGCTHLENEALTQLRHVSGSLRELELRECRYFRDDGLLRLAELKGLRGLTLGGGLVGVADLAEVVKKLRERIPECEVTMEQTK